MPEALLAIPPLQISSDNSSETDNAAASVAVATDRSSSSQNSNRPSKTHRNSRSSVGAQFKNKPRKSNAKRPSKKAPSNVNSQQKKTAVKSQIPRSLLLTPSSSSTSLSPHSTFRSSPLTSVQRAVTTKEQTITAVLQRQKTGIILAYRAKKSISQMDMKHFRRNLQFPLPPRDGATHAAKSLMASNNCAEEPNYAFSHNDASFVHRMYTYNNFSYDTPEREARMAGMKIFGTIMLNAWRKRRDEVKRLMEEVAELKRGAIKSRNQLHVLNTLFRVEQKRNDELSCQLKHSLDNINTTKSSCESLATSLISLKADNALLEQQLQIKEQEFENLNSLLSQTKSDLFKSMTVQRELQVNISVEQRKVQTLENQKNELINEIYELNNESQKTEQELHAEIQANLGEFHTTQTQLRDLEEQVFCLNECREQQLCESNVREENMRKQIETLQNEVKSLNKSLEETVGSRLKSCLGYSATYPKDTLHMLHWFAYYLLPATPPPNPNTFPYWFILNKVISAIKR